MIQSGLISITFRQLSPQEIIDLVARAGLDGIEWGGDVHVPHGDLAQARRVRRLTEAAGLTVTSYGSYYRVGHPDTGPFAAVRDTAVELGAPLIRVWPGRRGTDVADDAYWHQVTTDMAHIVALAAEADLEVATEFHINTLTDSNESALRLLQAVKGLTSHWQPPQGAGHDYNLAGLEMVLPWLRHLHVFSWRARGQGLERRLPLEAKAAEWQAYLATARTTGRDHVALLEFVQDDAPQNFLRDAAVLRDWLRST